jgi:hypothetical protein
MYHKWRVVKIFISEPDGKEFIDEKKCLKWEKLVEMGPNAYRGGIDSVIKAEMNMNARKKYYENRKKVLKERRKYYRENKKKISAAKKLYYKQNKERIKQRAKEYYAENERRIRARRRRRYKKAKQSAQG